MSETFQYTQAESQKVIPLNMGSSFNFTGTFTPNTAFEQGTGYAVVAMGLQKPYKKKGPHTVSREHLLWAIEARNGSFFVFTHGYGKDQLVSKDGKAADLTAYPNRIEVAKVGAVPVEIVVNYDGTNLSGTIGGKEFGSKPELATYLTASAGEGVNLFMGMPMEMKLESPVGSSMKDYEYTVE